MFRTIVEKEIRDIIGSTKFAVSFGVCAVLILLSFYMGAANYQVAREQHEAAVAENRRQLDGLTDWFGVSQYRIFLPPEPMAVLVNGVSNDIARISEIRGRGEVTSYSSRFGEQPILAIFRFLDFEFLFQVVLSLFAILLCYDAISGEKERGTLRLTFANHLPRSQYLLGKMTGSLLAVSVPLLATIAIGALLFVALGVPMSGADWGRLVMIVMTGLAYVVFFLVLSILISSLTNRSANSLLILLVIWIGVVHLVPRASVLLAGRVVDVPSVDSISAQKAKLRAQPWNEDKEKMSNFKPENSSEIDKIVSEFNSFMENMTNERDAKLNELSTRLTEERENKQREQERLAFSLARVSPAASFTLASTALAGTDMRLKNHYTDEANLYQKTYAAFMKEKTGFNPGGRMMQIKESIGGDGEVEQPKPIDPNELPGFQYQEIGLGEAVADALPDVGLLFVYSLLAFAGSLAAFNRYDLR